jgi:hypothetical protein
LGEFEEAAIFGLKVARCTAGGAVLIIGCLLFRADCREDSFARILRLFQAEKRSELYFPERESVIIELGWFIAGCSILLFRADHC